MNKPTIKNGFNDTRTGIQFIIPSDRQVSDAEAEALINTFVAEERNKLFALWREQPENKDWNGDIEAKKNELFAKRHPRGSEVVLIQPNEQ